MLKLYIQKWLSLLLLLLSVFWSTIVNLNNISRFNIYFIYVAQSVQKIEGCPRVEGCSLKNYIKSSIYNFIFGNCWDDKSCKGEIETKCVSFFSLLKINKIINFLQVSLFMWSQILLRTIKTHCSSRTMSTSKWTRCMYKWLRFRRRLPRSKPKMRNLILIILFFCPNSIELVL